MRPQTTEIDHASRAPSSGRLRWTGDWIATLAVVIGGAASIFLIASRGFRLGAALFGMTVSPILYQLCRRHIDVILFLAMVVSITPYASHYGVMLFTLAAAIKLFDYLVIERRRVVTDAVVLLWLTIGLFALLTVPRWHALSLGIRATNTVIVVPLMIYLLFMSGCIGYPAIRRVIRVYIPVLSFYLILQMVASIVVRNISLSSDWTILHGSFDLEWGRHNTIAAVAVLFAAIGISHPAVRTQGAPGRRTMIALILMLVAIPLIIVSRGAMLSLIGALVVYYLIDIVHTKRINVWKVAVSASIAAILAGVVFYRSLHALVERFVHMRADLAALARLQMIYNTLLKIRQNPVIGAGPDQLIFSDTIGSIHNNPHNVFLQYGAELGALAAIVIGIIFVIPLLRTMALRRISPELGRYAFSLFMLPLLAALINSQLELSVTLRGYGLVFWTIYAISLRVMDDLRAGRIAVDYL